MVKCKTQSITICSPIKIYVFPYEEMEKSVTEYIPAQSYEYTESNLNLELLNYDVVSNETGFYLNLHVQLDQDYCQEDIENLINQFLYNINERGTIYGCYQPFETSTVIIEFISGAMGIGNPQNPKYRNENSDGNHVCMKGVSIL